MDPLRLRLFREYRDPREAFTQRLPILARIADGEVVVPLRERCQACGNQDPNAETERELVVKRAATPGEQVRALEALARVGMSGNVSVDDVRLRMIAQVRATRTYSNVTTTVGEAREDR